MSHTRRILGVCALVCLPTFVHALPMTYDYSGQCFLNCDAIGLTFGDAVSRYITAGDGFEVDNEISGSELIDFAFDFGVVQIRFATHVAVGSLGLNPDLSIDTNVLLDGIVFQSWTSGAAVGGALGLSGWIAGSFLHVALGKGDYVAAIPEPGALILLGAGLVGLGLSRSARHYSFTRM